PRQGGPSGAVHVKSASAAAELWTFTTPDCGLAPTFDTIWAAGTVDEDDVLSPRTMFEPNDALVPLRSGEMAPMNAYRLGLWAIPFWSRVAFWLISYQRTSAPSPPADAATVCWVQIPTLPPNRGSGD